MNVIDFHCDFSTTLSLFSDFGLHRMWSMGSGLQHVSWEPRLSDRLPWPRANNFLLSRMGPTVRPTWRCYSWWGRQISKTWYTADSTCSIKSPCVFFWGQESSEHEFWTQTLPFTFQSVHRNSCLCFEFAVLICNMVLSSPLQSFWGLVTIYYHSES